MCFRSTLEGTKKRMPDCYFSSGRRGAGPLCRNGGFVKAWTRKRRHDGQARRRAVDRLNKRDAVINSPSA
jgi:hypothetical protein